MNGLQSKPSSSPPTQFQAQQYQRTHTPHTRGPTPPQYYIGTQEADPQGTQFTGISYQAPFQYSSISSQFVPSFGYANPHDLNKQGYGAPRMPVGGNPPQAAMYQNTAGIRQQTYFSQNRSSGYQPQPNQGLYPQQQIMFMPPPQYGSTAQVIMPMTATNYPQRMASPAYQNSMPAAQQGLYQLPQENTGSFTPHAHTHTYNNPPAVFYNAAQQQNRPPSASGMSGPLQQPAKKRERTVLQIIDPTSGKDILQDIQQTRVTPPLSTTLGPHNTISGQETHYMPQNEIAAQFAAQVAQAALGTHQVGNQQRTQSDGTQYVPQVALGTHPVGNQPRTLSEGTQYVPQVALGTPVGNQQRPLSVEAQFAAPVAQVALGTHPVGNQQKTQSEGTQYVPQVALGTPVGNQQRPLSDEAQFADQVALSIHPVGNQQRILSDVTVTPFVAPGTHPGAKQQRTQSDEAQFVDQEALFAHPVGNQQRTLSDVTVPQVVEQVALGTQPVGNQQRTLSDVTVPQVVAVPQVVEQVAQVALSTQPVGNQQRTQSGAAQYATQVALSTHLGGNQQRIQPEEAQFADQSAQVTVSAHTGGNQQRTLSEAKDAKKDERGKKKSKDINRKGETKQGSEMDAFMDLPTETEASSPVVEKGNEDAAEVAKIQDKAIATETTLPPPFVNEEVVVSTAVNIEKVDSTDVGITVENEKNEKLKLESKEDQWSRINHESKKQYEGDFHLQLPKAPEPTLKPLDLPDISDIIIKKPAETEASAPVVEKEKEEPIESAIIKDKVIASEMTPPTPIVNEEVVDTVEINIENVDGCDVSVAVENENEKMKLKYKYKEDQWSPINHEGKKQYDRDFLLQLQNAPESTLKPLDLPDIPDIIIEKPQTRSANRDFAEGSSFVDFTPRYVWSGGPNRSGGVPRRASGQRGRGGSGGSSTQAKHINLSIQKDIELHHAKEAWKPGHKVEKMDGEVDLKSEELFKKVRAILNKLTPQKFQTLVAKMQALEIDTEARLKSVIDLVFEKAISEPGFSVAYANMCRCLSMFKVPAESKQGDVNFRALLLTRCQREFEKANSSEKEFDSKRKEIEKATAEEQKQQMKEELEAEETKAKRRSLGNIRFIGELFKLKMLTENIMHDCVFKLLRTKDEENLECLCRLLKTIGKELETDKAKPRMDQYFAQMQKIVNEKKLSSRVRFMLQDVIELRQGKWVPRRDDNNPKTIDQIHREVAQEAQDRAIFVQTLPQAKPQKGSRGRPGQPSGSMGGGADGWNTVSRTPLRTDRTIDPTKLKLSKLGDSENIQLGPGGGAARLGWFKGSTGGGARSQEGERPNAPGNRFSALSKADKSEDDGSRRGGGRGFGRPGPSSNSSTQESEREKALAAAKTIVAQRPSEERSSGREPERAKTMEKPSTPVQEFTDDQIINKTRAIMDEYLHIQDVQEAISCVQELSASGSLHLFVYNALNQVLERSEVARRQTGQLLHDLVKNNVLLVDTYVKGLNEILMFAEDMEIDIPKIWEYLGQLIGPMVQDGSVPLGFLKQVCEPLKANGKSGILVAEILHDASHREGHKKVGKLWAESRLHWSDFVPKNQIEQFLSEKKLEFTKGGNSVPTSPTASMAIPKIEERLNDLITNKGCSNEEVFDWIEEEVDELTVKQEYFIRSLMTAVCKSAVIVSSTNLMKVDKSQIQRRNNLLQKYLDHQANFELQALFALQALVHKLEHPPGVLRELFDILYDEDIISEDAFIQWEKSEDPQEQEGKGVAMKQVVQFFTWLKEAEDDAES